ncbi:histidine phosphatase family protein [Leptolyngbya iicbica]|uniref:Histidine phosphatase family protein n=2 Tax=Cyanophyceae TaxID=3028117 RepID=A0A4Q7EAN2_9CYAN|nr:histidine phosphatase family protein [Leptolyngbya sp. LK]RZM79661.1 histidine phosphatase family protein [Leptolyngbya sp. LK]
MSLCVYMIRHGETTASRTDVFSGKMNPDLNEAGFAMARHFAEKYASMAWQAVYVSPMQRTQSTARPFCEATGLDMQLRDGLKEMSFGEWENLTKEQVQEKYPEDYVRWLTEPAWNPPTGGESAVQVASRASLVMSEIEEKHKDGNVLVVAHKSTLRVVLCSLLGLDLGRYRDRITFPVASVSVVEFGVHGPLLVKHGDRSHLPADLDARPGT